MKNTFKLGIILGLLLVCVGAVSAENYVTVSHDGDNTILTYDIVGSWSWTAPNGVSNIDYLVVAGGGSGGRRNDGNGGAGGGGAGGMLDATNYPVTGSASYPIVVGAGGAGQTITPADGNNGQNSSFNGIVAVGGGGGAAVGTGGKNGGSGGGGDYLYVDGGIPGNGIPGQGYPGGQGDDRTTSHGGGGGGAGGPGHDARYGSVPDNGGIGRQSSITGTLKYYAGGGAGGYSDQGGLGGGGNATGGIPPFSGTDGTGGGGGNSYGAIGPSSGAGGSGVVIIRYHTPPFSTFTTNVTSGIAPFVVQFTDTSGNSPTSWNWSFTGYGKNTSTAIFSTVQNPIVVFEGGRFSIQLNTTNSSGYIYPSNQVTFVNVTSQFVSTGGCWTATDGIYDIMMWNATGPSAWTAPNGVSTIDYLVVAGGGSGGRRNDGNGGAGGGGAGGMLDATNYPVTGSASYPIVVGAGGAGQTITPADGNNGQNSSFNGIVAVGGGGGAAVGTGGKNGGSGGGGDYLYVDGGIPGNGIPGQGYPGGQGDDRTTSHGGGGGGAGGPGHDARYGSVPDNGGIGRQSSITGTLKYYAGGGAGGYSDQGGLGGGGNATGGIPPFSGTDGTGGGGGNSYGAIGPSSGAGGSGVVIIKYLAPVLPVANFTSNLTTVVRSLPVQFNDTSTGSPISWNWSFGDGTFSIIQNPIHAYTAVGPYSVMLNATNSYGTNTTIKIDYINVISPLVASFSMNATSGTAPLTVQFNDTATGFPTAWNWSFRNITPGNNTQVRFSIQQNPTHTFGDGNYSIVLNASNSVGYNISTQVTFINVSTVPVVVVNVTTTTGVYRPGVGFYLKMDNGSTWNPSSDKYLAWDNAAGDLPIDGDWNADGRTETGVYRPGVGFYLKWDNGSSWNPSTDKYLSWDNAAIDLPIAGDWNADGRTETGVYRPGVGFYLKWDNGSSWTPSTDKYLVWDNAVSDLPIAGDWNMDGRTETGVYRPGVGFYIKMDNGNNWNPSSDAYLAWDNAAIDRPVAGDWNADGRSETGVYRPGVGFYLKMDNSSTWSPSTDKYLAWDNAAGDLPIAGNFV